LVAVKNIKAGMDTKTVLARFEAEGQALSMMDHPHIVQVLGVGTTAAGHSCFAAELVAGQGHPDHRVLRRPPADPRFSACRKLLSGERQLPAAGELAVR
jgi:hypothetical protein